MVDKTPLENHETLCEERWRGMRFRILRLESIIGAGFAGLIYFMWEMNKLLGHLALSAMN